MKFKDIVEIYIKKKNQYGKETYKYVSEILAEAKFQHKKDFKGTDHEQS